MKIRSLLPLALVALAPFSAVADNLLVKFDGAIGADSVSAATAGGVTLNIVRGVQPRPAVDPCNKAISIIIFVIALTFSARCGASAAGAEPNDFTQIAEM
jgi:hypothetical protein